MDDHREGRNREAAGMTRSRSSLPVRRLRLRQSEGMTLVEVLIAIFLIVMVLAPAAALLTNEIGVTQSTKHRTVAAGLATSTLNCTEASHLSQLEGQLGIDSSGLTYTPPPASQQAPCTLNLGSQYEVAGSPGTTRWGSSTTNTAGTPCQSGAAGPGLPNLYDSTACVQETDSVSNSGINLERTQTMQFVTAASGGGETIPVKNTCYGGTLNNSPPIMLETTTTVSWPQHGKAAGTPGAAATAQSRLFTPSQIDVEVYSTSATPPGPYNGASVTISGPTTMSTLVTGTTGCVSFVGIAQGNYTVTAKSGSTTLGSQGVDVTPGSIHGIVIMTATNCTTLGNCPAPPGGPPVVDGIYPTEGPIAGGNTVYICGNNFSDGSAGTTTTVSSVFFGADSDPNRQAAQYTLLGSVPTEVTDNMSTCDPGASTPLQVLQVTAPAWADASQPGGGNVNVVVANSVGEASNQPLYTYTALPIIYTISENQCTPTPSGCVTNSIPTGWNCSSSTDCYNPCFPAASACGPVGTASGGQFLELYGYNFSGVNNVAFCIFLPSPPSSGGQPFAGIGPNIYSGTLSGLNPSNATTEQQQLFQNGNNSNCGLVDATFQVQSDSEITLQTPSDWFYCPIGNPGLYVSYFNFCTGLDIPENSAHNYAALFVTSQYTSQSGQSAGSSCSTAGSCTLNVSPAGGTQGCPETNTYPAPPAPYLPAIGNGVTCWYHFDSQGEPPINYTDNACDAAGNPLGYCLLDTDEAADGTGILNTDTVDPYTWTDNACDMGQENGWTVGGTCASEPDGDGVEPPPTYSDNQCDAAGNPLGWCYTDTDALADATSTGNGDATDQVNWTDNACDAAGNPGWAGCNGNEPPNGSDGDGEYQIWSNEPGINWSDDLACDANGNPSWCNTDSDGLADSTGTGNGDATDQVNWTDNACDAAGNPGWAGCNGNEPPGGCDECYWGEYEYQIWTGEPGTSWDDNTCDAANNGALSGCQDAWADNKDGNDGESCSWGSGDCWDFTTGEDNDAGSEGINWYEDNTCDAAGNPGNGICNGNEGPWSQDGDEYQVWTGEPGVNWDDNACDAAGNPGGFGGPCYPWAPGSEASADGSGILNTDVVDPGAWNDNACDMAGSSSGACSFNTEGPWSHDGDETLIWTGEPGVNWDDNACDAAGNPGGLLGPCYPDIPGTEASADVTGILNTDVTETINWTDPACDYAGNPGGHGCAAENDGDETYETNESINWHDDNACDAVGNPLGWCLLYTDEAADGTGTANSDATDPYTWTDNACDMASNTTSPCATEPDGDETYASNPVP